MQNLKLTFIFYFLSFPSFLPVSVFVFHFSCNFIEVLTLFLEGLKILKIFEGNIFTVEYTWWNNHFT